MTRREDYQGWALAMCTLLDRIENENEDPEIDEIVRQRFALAEQYGFKVEWSGVIGSGEKH